MRARLLFVPFATGALFLLAAQAQTPAVPQPGAQPALLTPPPGVTVITPAAPGAATQRVRGTVQEFDGPFLTLTVTGKKTITLGMTGATRIVRNRLLQIADLQVGSYVGIEALKGADNKLRAQGIRVYPPEARGAGEGLYPAAPDSQRFIVAGTISAFAPGGIGGVLSLSFHGAAPDTTGACVGRATGNGLGCSGAADVQFARGVPIMAIETGDGSQLQPGAMVSASATANPDGTLVATSVTIERDPIPKEH
jgi:hypothetical protein